MNKTRNNFPPNLVQSAFSKNLAIKISCFTCHAHIFTDRKLKIGMYIKNVLLHLQFNFRQEIPTP
jgi:hypothetical protein